MHALNQAKTKAEIVVFDNQPGFTLVQNTADAETF